MTNEEPAAPATKRRRLRENAESGIAISLSFSGNPNGALDPGVSHTTAQVAVHMCNDVILTGIIIAL
jgi:hypothetical protein